MSIMATEEQSNRALVTALAAASATTALLPISSTQALPHLPSTLARASSVSVSAQPAQATVATVAKAFPATNMKLNSILRN